MEQVLSQISNKVVSDIAKVFVVERDLRLSRSTYVESQTVAVLNEFWVRYGGLSRKMSPGSPNTSSVQSALAWLGQFKDFMYSLMRSEFGAVGKWICIINSAPGFGFSEIDVDELIARGKADLAASVAGAASSLETTLSRWRDNFPNWDTITRNAPNDMYAQFVGEVARDSIHWLMSLHPERFDSGLIFAADSDFATRFDEGTERGADAQTMYGVPGVAIAANLGTHIAVFDDTEQRVDVYSYRGYNGGAGSSPSTSPNIQILKLNVGTPARYQNGVLTTDDKPLFSSGSAVLNLSLRNIDPRIWQNTGGQVVAGSQVDYGVPATLTFTFRSLPSGTSLGTITVRSSSVAPDVPMEVAFSTANVIGVYLTGITWDTAFTTDIPASGIYNYTAFSLQHRWTQNSSPAAGLRVIDIVSKGAFDFRYHPQWISQKVYDLQNMLVAYNRHIESLGYSSLKSQLQALYPKVKGSSVKATVGDEIYNLKWWFGNDQTITDDCARTLYYAFYNLASLQLSLMLVDGTFIDFQRRGF